MHLFSQRSRGKTTFIGFAVLLVALSGVVVPNNVLADTIYSYIDEQGTPVWTDNYNSIPERYRAKVKTTEQPPASPVPTTSLRNAHQLVTTLSKGITDKLGAMTPEISGLTPYQARIATYAGLVALVCLIAIYLSRSQVVKFLALWVLILLGITTPVLLYTSQDGPGDAMKAKATDAAKKQHDRLQQTP